MSGKLLAIMTIRSNIMFSTYLCAHVTKGTSQKLWCPKRTGMETIKCKASWIILVTRIKEKAQVVLALSYSFLSNDSQRSLKSLLTALDKKAH